MKTYDNQLTALGKPALMPFTVAVVASVAVIFFLQLENGSLVAAAVPALCGVAGLLLRWTAMPAFFVCTTGYFYLFPLGIPSGPLTRTVGPTPYFHIEHLILTAAVLVYLTAQLRLFLLLPAKNDAVPERPEQPDPREFHRIGWSLLAFLVAGQVLWMIVMTFEPVIGRGWPLRIIPDRPDRTLMEVNRLLLLTLLVAVPTLIAWLAFRITRIYTMKPAEARMILVDEQWRELRRELARQETWRAHALRHSRSATVETIRTMRAIIRYLLLFLLVVVVLLFLYLSSPFMR